MRSARLTVSSTSMSSGPSRSTAAPDDGEVGPEQPDEQVELVDGVEQDPSAELGLGRVALAVVGARPPRGASCRTTGGRRHPAHPTAVDGSDEAPHRRVKRRLKPTRTRRLRRAGPAPGRRQRPGASRPARLASRGARRVWPGRGGRPSGWRRRPPASRGGRRPPHSMRRTPSRRGRGRGGRVGQGDVAPAAARLRAWRRPMEPAPMTRTSGPALTGPGTRARTGRRRAGAATSSPAAVTWHRPSRSRPGRRRRRRCGGRRRTSTR